MFSVLHTFELREDAELWTKLLSPLRALVPCEDVKVVVKCLGAPPLELTTLPMGPFDPTIKLRGRRVTYVEHWSDRRIDGQAALTQRMQKIPSQENNRHHWDQFEVAKSQIESLRCMVAVPLFDADSNVLAVLKFVNRCTPEGLPILEFSKADQITLSAFAAIFTCICRIRTWACLVRVSSAVHRHALLCQTGPLEPSSRGRCRLSLRACLSTRSDTAK
jgi:hypothetical protein